MVELCPVWIKFSKRNPRIRFDTIHTHKKLEMVAVGAKHRFREANRLVAARPVKGRLKHDLLRGIALGLVKSSGWLWLAEDISDTVIADSVAGAEVGMRVVIKSAPTDPARILRIRSKLVVNSRMA